MPGNDETSERDGGEAIDELLSNPPANDDEMRRRLRGIDAAGARTHALDLLRDWTIDANRRPLLCRAMAKLGLGPLWGDFSSLVEDRERSIPFRSDVLSALRKLDADRAERLRSRLSDEDRNALAERGLIDVLQLVEDDPDAAQAFSDMLDRTPQAEQQRLFESAEEVRKKAGTPAAVVWSAALRNRRLGSLRPLLLEPVIQEGGAAGEELIEGLIKKAPGKKARRELHKALMRLRAAGIDPKKRRTVEGRAFVSSSDGQGAVIILGCFPGPQGTLRTADVVIRLTEDVRDAFMLPSETMREVRDVLDRMCEGAETEFAEISLAEAADLVMAAAERTRALRRKFTKDMKTPLALFERAASGEQPKTETDSREALDTPRSGGVGSLNDFRRLLEEPLHSSWFFDIGDLVHVDAPPPPPKRTSKKWLSEAAAALAGSDEQRRLMANLEYMARWYRWRGDGGRAELCDVGLEQCERDFEGSSVLRAVLETSARLARENVAFFADSPLSTGDIHFRRQLRRDLFADVRRARGRDLALLDFTELAFQVLDRAFNLLPSTTRPRQDDQLQATAALGRVAADFYTRALSGKGHPTLDGFLDRLILVLDEQLDLPDGASRELGFILLPELQHFVETACGHCPVACIERPDEEMDEPFRSDTHPTQVS